MRLHAEALDFTAIRSEFELPGSFPAEAASDAAAARDHAAAQRVDATDVEFVTIDPPGAMDLDQALQVESRAGGGYRVRYAIADLGALVEPGSALEEDSLRRGKTVYLPDGTVPLHPPVLSEGAASLLPDQDRPAVLWTVDVDADGVTTAVDVRRALVRSRARLDYAHVQVDADAATLHPSVAALPAVGALLHARGVRCGAVNLRMPTQEVARTDAGWDLRIEPRVPADEWNAQISLLVGRAAAALMLAGGVGMLRTLPPADADAERRLRTVAAALELDWPDGTSVGEFLDAVDESTPAGLAVMRAATSVLRGAGYRVLETPVPCGLDTLGADEVPAEYVHSGIGGAYAHVTAPIRRVGDRYATEACLALAAGRAVPDWVTGRLGALPAALERSDRLAGKVDRACVDLAEATVLSDRVGDEVEVTVLRAARPADAGGRARPAEVWCADPPVLGECGGAAEVGRTATARIAEADPARRLVRFEIAGPVGE